MAINILSWDLRKKERIEIPLTTLLEEKIKKGIKDTLNKSGLEVEMLENLKLKKLKVDKSEYIVKGFLIDRGLIVSKLGVKNFTNKNIFNFHGNIDINKKAVENEVLCILNAKYKYPNKSKDLSEGHIIRNNLPYENLKAFLCKGGVSDFISYNLKTKRPLFVEVKTGNDFLKCNQYEWYEDCDFPYKIFRVFEDNKHKKEED